MQTKMSNHDFMCPGDVQDLPPTGKKWFRKSSLGLSIALAISMLPNTVSALALGKLSTFSHMGERLAVEIDIPESTPEELAGLKASLASPDVFTASGVDFNPSLVGADVSVQKRPDGRPFIKVTTTGIMNDPFVNLILVVNWPAGRIVRDYSLLLDPVEISNSAPTVTTVPTTSTTGGQAMPRVAAPKVDAPRSENPTFAKTMPKSRSEQVKSGTGELTVATGMTAGEIALANLPEGVSLDQMLVALVKANPTAFINGNVNLVRAGAVLNLPDAQQAASQTREQARKVIVAQSQDFQSYKAKLAGLAPATETITANRQSGGRVEAKVTERKIDAAAPDKLLLSKADKENEAKIAKELQAKEDATRLAALSKNISALNQQLGKAGGAPSVAGSGSAAVGQGTLPGLAVGSQLSAPSSAAQAAVAPSAAPSTATAAASEPVNVGTPKPTAVAPTPIEEPGFLERLSKDYPLFLPLGAGLIALLGIWAWLRQRDRKKDIGADSTFFESRLRSDSFFGASGGQQVDTVEGEPASAATYTASQLSEAADVDPIAEADVYLAYGRDIQAEEILKDAMLAQPNRLAIPLKLLELYAKRSDTKAFDKLTSKVKLLTQGTGPEWKRALELAKSMNGSNAQVAASTGAALRGNSETESMALSDTPKQYPAATNPAFGSVPTVRDPASVQSMMTNDGAKAVSLERDFEFSSDVDVSNNAKAIVAAKPINNLNTASNATYASKEASSGPNIIDFDLSALSLDLNSVNPAAVEGPVGAPVSDPWATKLALAKEFQQIGDQESARKLLQEVSNGANESVKAEAKKLLSGMT
jgi:pilus assembly protein FimV